MEHVAEAWSQEMRRGYLKLAVLTIVSTTPSSGYGIMKDFRERTLGFWKITTGSIYPVLQELEEKKYIEGKWKTQGKRRRKIYTITPIGLQLLEEAIKKQQQIAETLESLIREYVNEVLDTDVLQLHLPLSINIFTMFSHLAQKPLEEQKRILENLHEQLQTALTRINERLRQLHAEN